MLLLKFIPVRFPHPVNKILLKQAETGLDYRTYITEPSLVKMIRRE